MSDHKYFDKVLKYVPNENQIVFTYGNKEACPDAKHFVMWSGGTDSTLLLYELLMAYGQENVIAISYKYPWLHQKKFENENQHREAFKAKMALRGFNNIQHHIMSIYLSSSDGSKIDTHQSGGLPQAVSWLMSIPVYMENECFVYDGGIREDDLTLVVHDYHEMFKNICQVLNKKIVLREPYLMFSKANILEKLIGYDLYEESWTCELPNDLHVPCMECTPCRTHLSALNEVVFSTKDELIRLKAQKEFDRLMSIKFPERKNNGINLVDTKED